METSKHPQHLVIITEIVINCNKKANGNNNHGGRNSNAHRRHHQPHANDANADRRGAVQKHKPVSFKQKMTGTTNRAEVFVSSLPAHDIEKRFGAAVCVTNDVTCR